MPPADKVDAAAGPAMQTLGTAAKDPQQQASGQQNAGGPVDKTKKPTAAYGPTTPEKLTALRAHYKDDVPMVAANFKLSTGKPLPDDSLLKMVKLAASGQDDAAWNVLTAAAERVGKDTKAAGLPPAPPTAV